MSYSVPISLLRQYCFCPRIPYFQELLGLNPPRPTWVKQGAKLHREMRKIFKHRTLQRFNLENARQEFNVSVNAAALSLHGVIDSVLISENEVYPLEFKLGGSKPNRGQIVQLTAYAMAAENHYGLPCRQGFVLFERARKTHPVLFTPEHQREVLRIRDRILGDLEKSILPHSSATQAQCTQCEYLNHCNDRGW